MRGTDGRVRGIAIGGHAIDQTTFDARVERAATGLDALGVGQGDCVAILMRNDIAFLEASYAAIRLGAYAVPINWHFHPEEIGYILRDCAAKVLITHADLLETAKQAAPSGLTILVAPTPDIVAQAFGIAPARCAVPADAQGWGDFTGAHSPWKGAQRPQTLSMIYTSGTTGHPKGVRRAPPTPAQQEALNEARRFVYGVSPGIRTIMAGPLYHSAPNAFVLRAARIAEALILMPRFEPEAMLAMIERERIDTLFMVPTMFVRLMKLPEDVRRRYDLSSLRFVMHAAAPCPAHVKRAMIEWWGPIISEFYGATESGAVTIVSSEEWLNKPGTVGRAAKGATISIQDEQGREVPQGQVGEIFSSIDYYPAFTYHNLPEKRAEIERGGMITVGDMGYLDPDGYLFLCDRKRDMVISGGVNIYPAEIEAVALAMPGIKDCAVFGIPDEEYGESLIALVEPMPGHALGVDAVSEHLKSHLASYKVPRRIEIAHDLPREDSGKIFKRRLREPYWKDAGRRI
jgi:long-chain acyl-CoA synthetase